jgi:ADP-heptose:LPS heptosyltransferase
MVKSLARKWLEIEKGLYLKNALVNVSPKDVDIEIPQSILCLQMNAIGDAIMTQPAWSALKYHFKECSIDLICRPHIAPIFTEDLAINSIYPFESQRYRPWRFKDPKRLEKIWAQNRYDLIFDFTALPLTSAVCAKQSSSPTIGFQRPVDTPMGEIDLGRFYDKAFPYSETAPLRELMMLPIALWKGKTFEKRAPVIKLSTDILDSSRQILNKNRIDEGFIVIHPGAKWTPKRWPISYWIDLIKQLIRKDSLQIVVMGSESDVKIINSICNGFKRIHVLPLMSNNLAISSAIIKMAAICLCNDSAAMHVAAAVGTKSVAIFGPVSPKRSAPSEDVGCYVLYENMFCSPCTLYYSKERCRRGINFCMHAIQPEALRLKIHQAIC